MDVMVFACPDCAVVSMDSMSSEEASLVVLVMDHLILSNIAVGRL